MKPLRLALFGFGTVGQWLAEALHTRRAWLEQEYGLVVTLISVATAHHGLIYQSEGLDIPTLLDVVATRQPLTAHPSVTHWTNALEGLQAISGDVLAEATGATLRNGEPGLSYIRTALLQGMHVVTSSKGPMALAGLELLSLARAKGVQLRMESTVMSGMPVREIHSRGDGGNQDPWHPRHPQRYRELHPQRHGTKFRLCRSTRTSSGAGLCRSRSNR